jgi:hypothetical protein
MCYGIRQLTVSAWPHHNARRSCGDGEILRGKFAGTSHILSQLCQMFRASIYCYVYIHVDDQGYGVLKDLDMPNTIMFTELLEFVAALTINHK